ncbi:hypothetical protein PsorP6_006898 [Peronosclerospora sorghi]|uniref:Uncharacterized protein n=1 Tax=Peronosclerospora sorghi TaxID=230839 RepID=A0ACC0W9D5_9STRA|nr:hypothetical protein PsorP6_006898 [Peronosclerospora sorghi]
MEQVNDVKALERELLDPQRFRWKLYDSISIMGVLCPAFYSLQSHPSSQVLLLAMAWLLAFSRFFDRQHRAILEVRVQDSVEY